MVAVNIKAFRGAVPRISERLQQPNFAKSAINVKITSGKLEPLLGTLFTANSQRSKAETLFRYRFNSPQGPVDNWLTWPEDLDVVENPLANDFQGRLYFSGPNIEPRMSTYGLIVGGSPIPDDWYVLGVAAPNAAPSVAVTGGSGAETTRSYACTFVTSLGEESGPSPASALVTGFVNGTWNLTALPVPPANSGTVTAAVANTPTTGTVRVTLNSANGLAEGEFIDLAGVVGMTDLNGSHRIANVLPGTNQIEIPLATSQTYTSGGTWARQALHNTTSMTKRIYRKAGTEGLFFFVAEIPAGDTTYSDTVADANLGETLPTLNTLPPPKRLTCLRSLPNGCLVGINGNELCFSDPYMPYSWPLANRYSFAGQGVAVVEAANSVIVLTEGFPIMFTGSDPEAMTPTVLETYAPCVSKRGVAVIGGGGLYPSFDGLYLVAPGRVENLTRRLYREEEWRKLNPSSFQAAYFDSAYYGAYLPEGETMRRMWKFDPGEPDSTVEFDVHSDFLYRNPYDGYLYLSADGLIYRWDGNASKRLTCEWQSVLMQLPKPLNFAVAQIHAEFGEAVELDQNQLDLNEAIVGDVDLVGGSLAANELLQHEVNGSALVPVIPPLPQTVDFTLYLGDQPIFTKQVVSSMPFRLPGGYLSETFRIGLSPAVPVYSFSMAQSVKELAEQPQ